MPATGIVCVPPPADLPRAETAGAPTLGFRHRLVALDGPAGSPFETGGYVISRFPPQAKRLPWRTWNKTTLKNSSPYPPQPMLYCVRGKETHRCDPQLDHSEPTQIAARVSGNRFSLRFQDFPHDLAITSKWLSPRDLPRGR